MHNKIAKLLEEKYPGVEFDFKIKPGQTGVDVTVPKKDCTRVGFEFAEIKPKTKSGRACFERQIENWGLKPGQVQAITYDCNGNVYLGW